MAKSKTFTTGQPLSAAEVNTYLNPEVPASGDPQSEGPVNVTAATATAGTVQFVRDGLVVHLRADLTLSLAAGAQVVLVTYGGIPAKFHPPIMEPVTASGQASGLWNRPCSAVMTSDGRLILTNNHSAAITQVVLSGTWIKGL